MDDLSNGEREYDHDVDELFDDSSTGEFHDGDVDGPQFTGWSMIKEFGTEVLYDDIDKILLKAARSEIPPVMDQIRHEIPGCNDASELLPSDFFNMWVPKTILDDMIKWIKKFTRKTVSVTDIGKFFQVEFYLSAYRCSPTEFYNSNLDSIYSIQKTCMDEEDYLFILRALSGNKDTDKSATIKMDDPTWDAKYVKNKDLEKVINHFRNACTEIANVPGKSKVGIDDDMIRIRSRSVAKDGFSHINNPAKGMGMVHHGIVSVSSRLYIGGQFQMRGQTTLDCMTMLQRSLSGAGCDSQIDLEETLFFWDRGYGGPDGIVNQETLGRNGLIAGTSKRTPSYPFNYGKQKANDSRMLISEKGTFATYWAEKNHKHGKRNRKHYAMAFRDGRGGVVLMHGNGAVVRPGQYVYVTEKGRGIDYEEDDKEDNAFFTRFEEEHVLKLTVSQGSPEWFLLRQFRITATAAYDVWNAVRNDAIIETNIAQVLNLLAFSYDEEKLVGLCELHETHVSETVVHDTPARHTRSHVPTPEVPAEVLLTRSPQTQRHLATTITTPLPSTSTNPIIGHEHISGINGPLDLGQRLLNSATKRAKLGRFESDYSSSGSDVSSESSDSEVGISEGANKTVYDLDENGKKPAAHVMSASRIDIINEDEDDYPLPDDKDSHDNGNHRIPSNEAMTSSRINVNNEDDDDYPIPDAEDDNDDKIHDIPLIEGTNRVDVNTVVVRIAATNLAPSIPDPFPYKRTQISKMNQDDALAAMECLNESTVDTISGKKMTVKQIKARLRLLLISNENVRRNGLVTTGQVDHVLNLNENPTNPASNSRDGTNQPRRRRRNLSDEPVDTSRLHLKLLYTWFMAPLPVKGIHDTRIGQAIERSIISALPDFFHYYEERTGIEIIRTKQYGLLSYKSTPQMAFSPDSIVLAKLLDGTNAEFLSLLEMKTKVSIVEEEKENDLADTHGKYALVTLRNREDGKRFKELIPETKFRTQILHGMASGDLNSAFYVVASTRNIIRIVHVHTTDDILHNYRLAMWETCNRAYLRWIRSGPIPNIPQEEYDVGYLSHVKDEQSLKETLNLWRCINDKVMERGSPLPKAKFILPKLVALWNRCKGPIDLYSQFLANVKARHPHLSPTGTIWLRMMMTCAYNAFMSYALNVSMWYLLSSPNCWSFRDYQVERKTNAGDFKTFLVELADSMSLFDIGEIPVSVGRIIPEVQPAVRQVTVIYNTRKCFFPGAEKDSLRLMKCVGPDKAQHGEALIPEKIGEDGVVQKRERGPQHCCALCCKAEHKFGKDCIYKQCKSRKPYRPRYYCPVCNVALCRDKKYAGYSCNTLCHSLPEIPVYCMNATILNIVNEIDGERDGNLGQIDYCNDNRVTLDVIKEAILRINKKKGYSKRKQDNLVEIISPPPRSARGTLGQKLTFTVVSEVEVPRRYTRLSQKLEEERRLSQQDSEQSQKPQAKKRRRSRSLRRRHSQTSQRHSEGSQQSTISSLQLTTSNSSQKTPLLAQQNQSLMPPKKRARTI
jgi:hypothetical protein